MYLNTEFIKATEMSYNFKPTESPIPGYYYVPKFPRVLISKIGKLFRTNQVREDLEDITNYRETDWIKNRNGHDSIILNLKNPNGTYKSLLVTKASLLAAMFLPKPKEFPLCKIIFKDGNSRNVTLKNMYIVPLEAKEEEKAIAEFTIGLYSDPIIPSSKFPGYYHIPNCSNYFINPDTIDVISTRKNENGIKMIPRISIKGYRTIQVISNSGLMIVIPRHRLLGALFLRGDAKFDIEKCITRQLVIDHKNGIPGDDRLENLEWVTSSENTKRCLVLGNGPKATPVAVKDITTGKIRTFDTIRECGQYYKFSGDKIVIRIRRPETLIWPEKRQYRDLTKTPLDAPWYTPDDIDLSVKTDTGSLRPVVVQDCITREETEYESCREAAKAINIGPAGLSKLLTENNQWVRRNGPNQYVRVKYLELPWRPLINDNHIADFILNKQKGQNSSPIIRINTKTGEKLLFPSYKECASASGTTAMTLNLRMFNKQFDKIDHNGYQYRLYDSVLDKNMRFYDE